MVIDVQILCSRKPALQCLCWTTLNLPTWRCCSVMICHIRNLSVCIGHSDLVLNHELLGFVSLTHAAKYNYR